MCKRFLLLPLTTLHLGNLSRTFNATIDSFKREHNPKSINPANNKTRFELKYNLFYKQQEKKYNRLAG